MTPDRKDTILFSIICIAVALAVAGVVLAVLALVWK